MTAPTTPRPFTGRKLALMICGMFTVVIGVNATMATLAVETFTGTVVDNGYIANQQFNRWIERGQAETAIGWTAQATTRGTRLIVDAKDHEGRPLAGAKVRVHLRHPLQHGDGRWLDPAEVSPGRYAIDAAVPHGQWDLQIVLERDGTVVHVRERLIASAR